PVDKFPEAKDMGRVKYYRVPWSAIRVQRLGGEKELSLVEAKPSGTTVKVSERIALTIKYRLTGARTQPAGETVMATIDVLGPQPIRLGTKPWLVFSPSVVHNLAEDVKTVDAQFTKPGNYTWRIVLKARGYQQTIYKSVPFRVTAGEYRLAR